MSDSTDDGDVYAVLFSLYIGHTINLLRLAAGASKQVDKVLKRMVRELVSRLSQTDIGYRNFASLTADARSIAGLYFKEAETRLVGITNGLQDVEAKFARDTLNKATGVEAIKNLPFGTREHDIFGAPAKDWWARQADDVAFKYASAVRQGITQNETNARIISRVWNREDGGVLKTTLPTAEALVRSSVMSVANGARKATFEANPDTVKGYIWLSTLDNRTSPICIARSGLKWDLDEKPVGHSVPFTTPPAHWNCRSALVPWVKTFRELGIPLDEVKPGMRASMDGPVPADLTFGKWLEGKTPEFQDELLGAGRAELWRNGTITLTQLLDQRGNPLTLEQLRAKYQH